MALKKGKKAGKRRNPPKDVRTATTNKLRHRKDFSLGR